MSTDDERREPREINEQGVIDLVCASRSKLAREAAKFRVALAELEYAAMALLVQEAAVTLLERSVSGKTPDIANTREIMALAIAGRLSGVLAPYFDGVSADRADWPAWAAGALEDLAAGRAVREGRG